MTAKELAHRLNGNEYLSEICDQLEGTARDNGLVVVFGQSDDLIQFRGAVNGEAYSYGGGDEIELFEGKLLEVKEPFDEVSEMKEFLEGFGVDIKTKVIIPKWDIDGYSWKYHTAIPHETFDILEDGEKYCQGIVFHINEIK